MLAIIEGHVATSTGKILHYEKDGRYLK